MRVCTPSPNRQAADRSRRVAREHKLDGKLLIRTSDESLTPAAE